MAGQVVGVVVVVAEMRHSLTALLLLIAPPWAGLVAQEKLVLGEPPPPLSLETLLQAPDGRTTLTWADLRDQVVVLEFWGTWCGPCVAAIDHLNALAKTFAGQPVRFVSITFEEEPKIRDFLATRSMNAWIGLDPDRSTVDAFGVESYPCTVLVDRRGRVAAVTYPTHVTDAVLQNLLDGKASGLFRPDLRVPGSPVEATAIPSASPVASLFEVSLSHSVGNEASMSISDDHLVVKGQPLSNLVAVLWDRPASRVRGLKSLSGEPFDLIVRLPKPDRAAVLRFGREAFCVGLGCQASHTRQEVPVLRIHRLAGDFPGLRTSAATDGSNGASFSTTYIRAEGYDAAGIAQLLEQTLHVPVLPDATMTGRFDFHVTCVSGTAAEWRQQFEKTLGLGLEDSKETLDLLLLSH